MSGLATARQMQAIHNNHKIISFESLRKQNEVKVEANVQSDKAGKSCEVYAFKDEDEIKAMIDVFDKHIEEAEGDVLRKIAYRNKMLFIIGINVGVRASDLRTLKWSFFFDDVNGELRFKNFYVLQPMKTRKQKKFVKLYFNQAVQTMIESYVSEYPIENLDEYLFASKKTSSEPIEVRSLWRIIKNAAREAGIEQNIGSHSLRKTWGYHCFHNAEDKSKALVMLQYIFNHSSQTVTMKYIGIMDDDASDIFDSLNLGLDFI